MSSVKNVAIVGASGQQGKHITDALLATGKHAITALSRPESTGEFPSDVTVKKVDYGSHSALVEALKGQDALIITLAIGTPPDQQTKLIEAAAEAGVSWVFPNEYGSDNAHPDIAAIPLNAVKTQYRQRVEELGKSSWIGIVNNPWYEYSLGWGRFGIDIKNRTASLYDDGQTKTVTTTMPQVGRAVASLLSLPVSGSSPSLSDYKNKFVYIESFFISQHEMLASVQRVTGTSPDDWNVSYRPAAEAVKEGNEKCQKGDFMGAVDILYGTNFMPGKGGDYAVTKGTANGILGLPKEDLDDATKVAVQQAEAR
ncbi:MAG: hypothetical protein M1816_007401 [Peltula sp. TS41687]|nr:MAG: hypothetical protein M1816_007401 [Peltula sp. TS41687]